MRVRHSRRSGRRRGERSLTTMRASEPLRAVEANPRACRATARATFCILGRAALSGKSPTAANRIGDDDDGVHSPAIHSAPESRLRYRQEEQTAALRCARSLLHSSPAPPPRSSLSLSSHSLLAPDPRRTLLGAPARSSSATQPHPRPRGYSCSASAALSDAETLLLLLDWP